MSDVAPVRLYSKDIPYQSRVLENRLLSGAGSEKETRHIVVDLGDSGLTYKPGDSIGIFPANDPAAVDALIAALGVTGEEPVRLPRVEEPISLREALTRRLSLAGPARRTIQLMASKATDSGERARLEEMLAAERTDQLSAFLSEREFIDLVEEFPSVRFSAQELVDQMKRLTPRLYSIASSPRLFPDRVHLLIAVVRYSTNGRKRIGVCSTFLSDRVEPGVTSVPVFLVSSHFGLPDDDAADIIMVGPGTGLAPFRAFLQERAARGAGGRNWLFFGEQRRSSDFLYEDELRGMQGRGVLHRLDTAFSRDQSHKVYVQDRMRENGAEIWEWLQRGAFFYVCGDAKRMARDVDQVLHEIVTTHGGLDPVATTEYVRALKREKRYQRDVY